MENPVYLVMGRRVLSAQAAEVDQIIIEIAGQLREVDGLLKAIVA